jgi:hypothetical protein
MVRRRHRRPWPVGTGAPSRLCHRSARCTRCDVPQPARLTERDAWPFMATDRELLIVSSDTWAEVGEASSVGSVATDVRSHRRRGRFRSCRCTAARAGQVNRSPGQLGHANRLSRSIIEFAPIYLRHPRLTQSAAPTRCRTPVSVFGSEVFVASQIRFSSAVVHWTHRKAIRVRPLPVSRSRFDARACAVRVACGVETFRLDA